MTTWTLILIFSIGSNSSVPIVIENIKSLSECERVGSVIKASSLGSEYRFSRNQSLCVEVLK